jgi:hypothetical protein
LFGLVLSCAGGAAELVRRKGSRAAVALFLEFMAVDFFGCFHDDPDKRELGLLEHLEDLASAEHRQAAAAAAASADAAGGLARAEPPPLRGLLEGWRPGPQGAPSPAAAHANGGVGSFAPVTPAAAAAAVGAAPLRPAEVWRRLAAWLSLWDAVGAPKSVAKHAVLLQVFVRLLAKPKAGVAAAALACVRAYKLPYLQPYDAQLRALVADEGSSTSSSGNSHGASSSSGNGAVKAHAPPARRRRAAPPPRGLGARARARRLRPAGGARREDGHRQGLARGEARGHFGVRVAPRGRSGAAALRLSHAPALRAKQRGPRYWLASGRRQRRRRRRGQWRQRRRRRRPGGG